ncbi:hypothetical protein ACJIZ3_014325 [Penstemon smallii]|uniref:Uncharacterized protein n=1 Tax=Penstemon smallii TaxID=265156 RepID=A0ABD3RJ78_9LAMI
MAHEALVSLHQLIIESFVNPLDLVLREVWSLKSILGLDHFEESERLHALKEEILKAIPRFKDVPIPEPQTLY